MKFRKSLLLLPILIASCSNSDGEGKINIEFWGWADAVESEIYQQMVNTYNASQNEVYVNYTKKPGEDYVRALLQALNGRSAPDIFYVPEENLKSYVSQDLIFDLTDFVKNSDVIDMNDMWDSLIERYSFDKQTLKYSKDASIWGLSKDLGVSAVFYNENAMKEVGIQIVSTSIDKVQNEDEKHGFYNKNGINYFNNRISMTWEELVEISKLLDKDYNPDSPTVHGYYDSKWYNFVWSVGGDSLKFVESNDPKYSGGYYEWDLDSKVVRTNDAGIELPTTKEALEFWIAMGLGKNNSMVNKNVCNTYGLESGDISPIPTTVTGPYNYFTDGKVAMFVIPRYAVPTFRRDCSFAWDVAPLPHHKDGTMAGYTTSMCYSIAERSTKKEAAFKFMEYMSGKNGQKELAKYGFNVPNQKSVTLSDDFLISNERPYNNIVFAEGAEYQTVGDWMYLTDNLWIDLFESQLDSVRNGYTSLDEMIKKVKLDLNEYLKKYTLVKK